ncbi:hypothetical protein EV383_0715 [Pseudonocardia sediminis]|uniref:Uncharacterized protein n=1 Tax=Pseudonocardia sediminis TaxID=1397368 RepID=A0A4Q7UV23_PSEST|nr:hypothetical protein EV383_0715 [Pseudonocardia sediminis]
MIARRTTVRATLSAEGVAGIGTHMRQGRS